MLICNTSTIFPRTYPRQYWKTTKFGWWCKWSTSTN